MTIQKQLNLVLSLSLLTILNSNPAWACNTIPDSVTINGKFSIKRLLPKGTVFKCKLIQKHALDTWTGFTKIFLTPIIDSKFQLRVPAQDAQFYLTLQIEYPDEQIEFLNFDGGSWECPLLFEQSDSITMSIGIGNYLSFSGRGAQKLNCQKNLYGIHNIPNSVNDRIVELINEQDFEKLYTLRTTSSQLALQQQLLVLDNYRERLTESIYKQLKLDLIGRHQYSVYWQLLTSFNYSHPEAIDAAIETLKALQVTRQAVDTSAEAIHSIHYANYLMQMERVTLQYLKPLDSSYRNFDFTALTNAINVKYSGQLRDKILSLAYMDMESRPGVADRIDTVIAMMGRGEIKNFLQQWKNKISAGRAAYPFRLLDDEGKIYRLEDFQGKVILADFWFNGCAPCKQMAKALKPIASEFKDEKNMVFLSINVDKNKEKWLSGIAENVYSFPEALHLSVAAEGGKDVNPFLSYYNFNGFPQLLIIDAEGKVVSSNPPNPIRGEVAALTKMIKDALGNIK